MGSIPTTRSTSKFGGSPPKIGDFYVLATLRDDSQAVVLEVFKAICPALDEFHLSVEALRNSVALTEAPHADDGFVPIGEGLGQGDEGSKAAGPESIDEVEQLRDQLASLACVDVLGSHDLVGFVHLLVDGFECRMISEEFFQSGLLGRKELVGTGA